jgi:hypothetical protein
MHAAIDDVNRHQDFLFLFLCSFYLFHFYVPQGQELSP